MGVYNIQCTIANLGYRCIITIAPFFRVSQYSGKKRAIEVV